MNTSPALSRPQLASLARKAAVILSGVVLITICAKLRVPSWPVPMTLHTLAIMGIAIATGPRLALATVSAYLVAGAAGLPVFSGTPERGIGLAYMMGPTGGYLLGFLLASWTAARLALGRGTIGRLLAMLTGQTITYAFGLIWLGQFVPAGQVFAAGFSPFILGDLINIAMVALGAAMLPARWIGKIGQ